MRPIPSAAGPAANAIDTPRPAGQAAASPADGDTFAALLASGLHNLPAVMAPQDRPLSTALPAAAGPAPEAAATGSVQAQSLRDQQRAAQQAAEHDVAEAQRLQRDAEAAAQQAAQQASQVEAEASAQQMALQAGQTTATAADTAAALPPIRQIGAGYAPVASAAGTPPATALSAGSADQSTAGSPAARDGDSSTSASPSTPPSPRVDAGADAQRDDTAPAARQTATHPGRHGAGAAVATAAIDRAGSTAGTGTELTAATPAGIQPITAADGANPVNLASAVAAAGNDTATDTRLQNLMGALQANLSATPSTAAADGSGLAGAAMLDGALAGVAGFGLGRRGGLAGPASDLGDALAAPRAGGAMGGTGSATGLLDSRAAFNPLATDALQQSAATAPEAVAPTLPVAPPVGDTRWAAALGQQALFMASQQLSSAQLSINPPHLGPVQIALDVQQGQATASFTTAHEAVRHAIESSLPQLRDMFAAAGMDLTQAQVQTGTSGNPQRQPANAAQDWQAQGSRTDSIGAPGVLGAATATSSTEAAARRDAQRGLLDTFA